MSGMTDHQLAQLSVLTALNNMMRGDRFDICTIDAALKALDTTPDSTAYAILRPLHCVSWSDMPHEMREAVPGLIERCLHVPAYQFQVKPSALTPEAVRPHRPGQINWLR